MNGMKTLIHQAHVIDSPNLNAKDVVLNVFSVDMQRLQFSLQAINPIDLPSYN